ncbi:MULTISPECIES: hypothetical protein [unclassified Bradyrhizobium]|uniref:hypothetical protein n=1 Tax=unclassified Bradyrhizobium TaxID=2631580 RepID=UPI00291619F8|nr:MULTISPECIES: hypothetical protein [unclassified Bradyrhizobium]
MSNWFTRAKLQCASTFPNQSRSPASTNDDDQASQALADIWDKLREGGEKVAAACNDLEAKFKAFKLTARDVANEAIETVKKLCDQAMSR